MPNLSKISILSKILQTAKYNVKRLSKIYYLKATSENKFVRKLLQQFRGEIAELDSILRSSYD